MIVVPRYVGKEIVLAIDSSKTNSAIAVGDMGGNVLDYIELNGAADGVSCEDTLRLCKEERRIIKELFRDAKIEYGGIENIITKNYYGKSGGINHHLSRFKITAVFMSFISCFQDCFDIELKLINNQEWKAGILPQEFRTREHKKGSLDFFKSINSRFSYCTDDVTDAICILEYLYKINNVVKVEPVGEPEPCCHEYDLSLVRMGEMKHHACKRFRMNPNLSLKQNAAFIANRIKNDEIGMTLLDTSTLSFEDIYQYCIGTFAKCESELSLRVERKR